MPASKIDKDAKKSILEARALIDSVIKTDANEAETRRRIERIFGTLMGYDVFKHITREFTIPNIGDTDYCDFAIVTEEPSPTKATKPAILVEIKRVSTELAGRHLKQTASYAIDIGCEWAILTNGRDWQLYHITFKQPPEISLILTWSLMNDDFPVLIEKFDTVGYKNVRKGGLAQLWLKSTVLVPRNVLKIILSESSITKIRQELKRTTQVAVTSEEVVGAVRRLLNESAIAEMDSIRIYLPEKRPASKKPTIVPEEKTTETASPPDSVPQA